MNTNTKPSVILPPTELRKASHNPHPKNYIHPTCVIGPNVEIGVGNHFGPFCLIGCPAEDTTSWGKTVGKVKIGNNNVFAGYNSVDAAINPNDYTTIGNGNQFVKGIRIDHDEQIIDNEYKFI